VIDPAQIAGERSAAPEPKTATVERREASVPRHKRVHARLDALWDARRLARRLACGVICRPNGCRCTRTSLGAPPPLDRGDRSKGASPGAKNAPRERDGLFDK
jgi:hypothetical protein